MFVFMIFVPNCFTKKEYVLFNLYYVFFSLIEYFYDVSHSAGMILRILIF